MTMLPDLACPSIRTVSPGEAEPSLTPVALQEPENIGNLEKGLKSSKLGINRFPYTANCAQELFKTINFKRNAQLREGLVTPPRETNNCLILHGNFFPGRRPTPLGCTRKLKMPHWMLRTELLKSRLMDQDGLLRNETPVAHRPHIYSCN